MGIPEKSHCSAASPSLTRPIFAAVNPAILMNRVPSSNSAPSNSWAAPSKPPSRAPCSLCPNNVLKCASDRWSLIRCSLGCVMLVSMMGSHGLGVTALILFASAPGSGRVFSWGVGKMPLGRGYAVSWDLYKALMLRLGGPRIINTEIVAAK